MQVFHCCLHGIVMIKLDRALWILKSNPLHLASLYPCVVPLSALSNPLLTDCDPPYNFSSLGKFSLCVA